MNKSFTFRKHEKVLKKNEFDSAFEHGHTCHGKVAVVKFVENNLECPRLGIIVKKTGNAIERNYKKRIIREAFRTMKHTLPSGFDYIVIARKNTPANLETIVQDLTKAAQKAKKCAGS